MDVFLLNFFLFIAAKFWLRSITGMWFIGRDKWSVFLSPEPSHNCADMHHV